MATELAGQWVGPMPVDKFISTFLPNSNQKPDFDPEFFDSLEEHVYESAMYDSFIKHLTVNAPKVIKGFKLVNTSLRADDGITMRGMKKRPDVSCFKSTVKMNRFKAGHVPPYEDLELIFEFETMTAGTDPFEDKPGYDTAGKPFPFEAPAEFRRLARKQIASYAREWCARQHRTHCFIVWIADPHARLIRVDRSGGIVSELFDYRQNGDLLLNFLWSFCHGTDSSRGLDQTVTKASPAEAVFARDKLYDWRTTGTHTVFKIQVPDPDAGPDRTRAFLVRCPLTDPPSVTGNATRGYAAWDIEKGRVVFLKDSWRSTEAGMEREVDILQELKNKHCRHVPAVLCGDDLELQVTQTKQFANEDWNIGALADKLVRRSHTRFTVKQVGSHITSGNLKKMTPKKFFQIVFDAFLAHHDAYTLCGILHRDISSTNILVNDQGRGFLNDWDMSIHINKDVALQQPFHSGTWQFMSAELLKNPSKLNTLQDDMQSFFWLILYHILRYMDHNRTHGLAENMKTLFDSEAPTGGTTKAALLHNCYPLTRQFEVAGNPYLTTFYEEARMYFKNWNTHIDSHDDEVYAYRRQNNVSIQLAEERVPLITTHLLARDHQAMIKLFEAGLLDTPTWCEGDFFVDRFPEPTPTPGPKGAGPQASRRNVE